MAKKVEYELLPQKSDLSYRRVLGNYPAKKYKKGTAAQLRLSFEFTGNTTQYIDIARALSIINRKMYRQGCYYYVNKVELYNNEDAFVDIHTIPDTWMTRAAYRRAKGVWDNMNQVAMQRSGDIAGKYYDFKVFMSDRHRSTGSANPALHDINSAAVGLTPDDWDYSNFVTADDDQDGNANADEFVMHMIGAHNGNPDNWVSVGVIKSYQDTRARVNVQPILDGDINTDPLLHLFDYSSEEQLNDIIDNLSSENDEPPYNADVMVGELPQHHQHVGRLVTTATLGRKDAISGFCAPLGLIMVDPQSTASAYRIVIELAEGTYGGTYAERMA